MLTAILANYQRPRNTRRIIPALRSQSLPVDVWLVDNGVYTHATPEQRPDQRVTPPYNVGPFACFIAATWAKTEWIYIQDDDLEPGDSDTLADLLEIAQAHPDGMTAPWARHVHRDPPHYEGRPDTNGPTNAIKTRAVLFRRDLLRHVPLSVNEPFRCDDLHASLHISQGERLHYAPRRFRRRYQELPTYGAGLQFEPQHYKEREAYCARFWQELA